jgi:TonB family protein
MNIPEEFGHYLLLKKLTEDPLGETFRAGKLGREGLEQVVLLRVLNGKGMDGERLWQKVSGRGAVQQALKSPSVGSGVDLGRVRSYPYTAYDYISGKNLAVLLAQSAKQGMPIPADHAMLIAERMSLALANAYESRVGDERVLHGFLTPHLVMISNEGETRLLGFEIAPGLRELAATGWRDSDLTPYLAPEAMSSDAIGRADDVWSLGAILFELLTGERLPAASPGGYGPAIDAAVTANDGTPFPAPIAALLKKSLVPRDQRIGDAVQWHKTLSKLMIEGHYSPTTFNLAFFMHSLFRDEIEREGQEMQTERKLAVTGFAGAGTGSRAAATPAGGMPPMPPMALPVAAASSAGAAVPPGGAHADLREKTGVREPTWPGTLPPEPAAGSRKGLLAAVAAVVVLGLGAGGWFLFGRGTGTPKTAPGAQPVAAMPAVPVAPAPQATEAGPAAPNPEEIQKQIATMFDARSKEMEAKLKGQYDDKIKGLQKQLEESKRPERATVLPAVSTHPESAVVEAKAPPKPEPTPEKESPAATTAVASTTSSSPPLPAAGTPKPELPRPEPTRAEPQTPARTAPASASASAGRESQPKPGDLVQLGPGVVKPQVAGMPDPRYPAAARRMNKAAQVDLKVLVDERGNVIQAESLGGRVGFGFDEAAMEAARRSTFHPATKDGVRVKMWTMLRVTFRAPQG